jgi:hypothetical protein
MSHIYICIQRVHIDGKHIDIDRTASKTYKKGVCEMPHKLRGWHSPEERLQLCGRYQAQRGAAAHSQVRDHLAHSHAAHCRCCSADRPTTATKGNE